MQSACAFTWPTHVASIVPFSIGTLASLAQVPKMRTVVETYTKTVYALQAEAIRDHFTKVTGAGQACSCEAGGLWMI